MSFRSEISASIARGRIARALLDRDARAKSKTIGPIQEKPTSRSIKIRVLAIAKPDLTDLNRQTVDEISESFSKIGQRVPVIAFRNADSTVEILCGIHRFAAASKLGWSHLDAVLLDGDDDFRSLVKIAENLHRKDLTALQRAEDHAKWIRLVQKRAAQVAHPVGGIQRSDRGLSKAAREMKTTRDAIGRSEQIDRLSREAKSLAKELRLDDNQRVLLAAAKATDAISQSEVLRTFAERKMARRRPPALVDGADMGPAAEKRELLRETSEGLNIPAFLDRRDVDGELTRLVVRWTEFRSALEAAPERARVRFIVEVMLKDPLVSAASTAEPAQ